MENPVAVDLVEFLNASPTAFHAVGNHFFFFYFLLLPNVIGFTFFAFIFQLLKIYALLKRRRETSIFLTIDVTGICFLWIECSDFQVARLIKLIFL